MRSARTPRRSSSSNANDGRGNTRADTRRRPEERRASRVVSRRRGDLDGARRGVRPRKGPGGVGRGAPGIRMEAAHGPRRKELRHPAHDGRPGAVPDACGEHCGRGRRRPRGRRAVGGGGACGCAGRQGDGRARHRRGRGRVDRERHQPRGPQQPRGIHEEGDCRAERQQDEHLPPGRVPGEAPRPPHNERQVQPRQGGRRAHRPSPAPHFPPQRIPPP